MTQFPRFSREGNELVIRINVSEEAINSAGRTKEGKNKLVASTKGFTATEGVRVSLNIIA